MFADFEELDATIIGVSMDSLESHRAFAQKHELPFPLIADSEGRLAADYGVSTRGGFTERVTFVIDREGRIAKVFPQVTPGPDHASEVLAACR